MIYTSAGDSASAAAICICGMVKIITAVNKNAVNLFRFPIYTLSLLFPHFLSDILNTSSFFLYLILRPVRCIFSITLS